MPLLQDGTSPGTHASRPVSTPASDNKHLNPFLNRLRRSGTISDVELSALDGLFTTTRLVAARSDLLLEGERKAQIHVLLEGWACGYRMLAEGYRQVTTVLLPGDVCDLDRLHVSHLNYAVSTLTPCTVAPLDCSTLRVLAARHPGVSASLGWLGAVENATLVERTVSFGRHSARKRLAHLLCELFLRLAAAGHIQGQGYVLPMRQSDISDALGISHVHFNRILQGLRSDGLIKLNRRELLIRDWPALRSLAEFRPDYLHLVSLDGLEPARQAMCEAGVTASKPASPRAAA